MRERNRRDTRRVPGRVGEHAGEPFAKSPAPSASSSGSSTMSPLARIRTVLSIPFRESLEQCSPPPSRSRKCTHFGLQVADALQIARSRRWSAGIRVSPTICRGGLERATRYASPRRSARNLDKANAEGPRVIRPLRIRDRQLRLVRRSARVWVFGNDVRGRPLARSRAICGRVETAASRCGSACRAPSSKSAFS